MFKMYIVIFKCRDILQFLIVLIFNTLNNLYFSKPLVPEIKLASFSNLLNKIFTIFPCVPREKCAMLIWLLLLLSRNFHNKINNAIKLQALEYI